MSDLIAQARMCAVCMIGSDECHRTDCEKSCIEVIDELADALDKAEAEVERLKIRNDTMCECCHMEMRERAIWAEAELAAYKEANPPRVHGEWVVDECDTTDDVPSYAWINFHCSVCNMDYGLDEGQYGWTRGEKIPYKCCPNCHADMRKEDIDGE